MEQFFTMVEYEKWKAKTKDVAGWKIKYYKGLGTSTAAEAKEYFGNIHDHRMDFKRLPQLRWCTIVIPHPRCGVVRF